MAAAHGSEADRFGSVWHQRTSPRRLLVLGAPMALAGLAAIAFSSLGGSGSGPPEVPGA